MRMALAEGKQFICLVFDSWTNPDDVINRVCPGQYVMNESLHINLALLLWSFRIVERPDAPIDTNAFTDTIVAHPAPFDVDFIPRIEEGWLKEMMSESVI
jgi:hypothetical protein